MSIAAKLSSLESHWAAKLDTGIDKWCWEKVNLLFNSTFNDLHLSQYIYGNYFITFTNDLVACSFHFLFTM